MCGILGIVHRELPLQPLDNERVARALDLLAYRGPDGSGTWKSDKVIFGHRRLSIIDLSDAGAQPFVDEKLGLTITFNGEIYNFKELRSRLASLGYTFKSQSDTEVILCAYDHYGMEFLAHLRGMFAFCIYDLKRHVVILARDSAGEKPLYYYLDNDCLVFSSEIKALHAFPDVDLSIDAESVKAFFVLQYVPGPHTVYKKVRKLPAGCAIRVDLSNWNATLSRYWTIEDGHAGSSTPEELDHLLNESVRYRLVADVEVGLLLSGGIDSALLASYAHRNGARLRTFTARFDEEHLDETHYARQVADQLGLEQIIVSGGQLTPEVFDRVIFHGDELLGDPACIPTFLLSQEISKYVKVVLSGEGADELFWGYDTYHYERVWKNFAWLRQYFSQNHDFQGWVTDQEILHRLPAGMIRLAKLFSSQYDIGASRWTSVFGDHTAENLVSTNENLEKAVYLHEIEQQLAKLKDHTGGPNAHLSGDLIYWLADDLLMKVDRMTMAHGVEARAPYLDSKVIQKALALPSKYKIRKGMGKFMLREQVEKQFPGEVGRTLAWRKKHGFEVPIGSWLWNNLHECVEDRLSPQKIARTGLLNKDLVLAIKKNFYSSPTDTPLRRKLWMLLCFQSWYEMHEKGFGMRLAS
jgi:asparagine synthase (glutamine-hydrolysing)